MNQSQKPDSKSNKVFRIIGIIAAAAVLLFIVVPALVIFIGGSLFG